MSLLQRVLKTGSVAGAVLGIAAIAGGTAGVLAQSQPPVARVFGSINFNGANAQSGSVVTAFAGSTQCGSSATSGNGGNYTGTLYYVDIDSSNAACNKTGTVITFQVGGQFANQTFSVPDVPGAASQLNLTGPSATQPGGGTSTGTAVTYPAGYNIVAGPAGTVFSQASVLYTFQAGDTNYENPPTTQPVQAGLGYFAYFPSSTTVTLSGNTTLPFTVTAPAGQYIMIGNPSATQTVTISGADIAYAFDPTNPSNPYSATTTLKPGQGAFVFSNAGGAITLQ